VVLPADNAIGSDAFAVLARIGYAVPYWPTQASDRSAK
jgi:hypothetical protein